MLRDLTPGFAHVLGGRLVGCGNVVAAAWRLDVALSRAGA